MLKRTLALILTFVILMTAGTFAAFADNDDLEILPGTYFKQGDVNIDGNINIKDVTLIQKILAKIKNVGDFQISLADVDGSKGLSIKDATHLQKWIADLVEELYSPQGTEPEETTVAEVLPDFGASPTTQAVEVTETTINALYTEILESSTAEDQTETETDAAESVSTDPEETTIDGAYTEIVSSSAESDPTEPEVITTAETVVTDPEEVTSSVAPTESDAVTEATSEAESEATEATETTTKITIITLPFIPAL